MKTLLDEITGVLEMGDNKYKVVFSDNSNMEVVYNQGHLFIMDHFGTCSNICYKFPLYILDQCWSYILSKLCDPHDLVK